MKQYNIYDAFNFDMTGRTYDGIFDYIGTYTGYDYPFASLIADADNEYLFSHGKRAVTGYLAFMLADEDNTLSAEETDGHRALTDAGVIKMAQIYARRYGDRLSRIYDALTADYEILENYNGTETHSGTDSHRHYGDNWKKSNHVETNSKVTTSTDDMTNDTSVYGFNSAAAVPESKQVSNGDVTTEGKKADNYTDSSEEYTGTDINDMMHGETITKHGNLGVTTSQQMVQSEIDLRIKADFFKYAFECADELMGLHSYTHGQSTQLLRDL